MTRSFSTSSAEPLRQHGRLRTDDADLAQQVVAEVYEPHTLSPVGGGPLDARLNAVQLGGVTLGYLTYGTEAHITLPASEHWYHINVTLTGSSLVTRENGDRGRTRGMAEAAILLPHRAQTIAWAPDAAQFALKVPRADLEDHLAALTRTRVHGPIDFDLVVDLESPAGKGLLRCIDFVRTEWDEDGVLARNGQSRRQLESMLLTSLLTAADGPHQELLRRLDESGAPRAGTVKSALDFIHDHADDLPTPADVAAAIGVSARTLQLRFLHDLGRTPSQYLRDIRLRAVRDALLYPRADGTTVTEAASAHGFFNLGRFSSLYKSVYGESPSETLRRTKGV
ncbi:MULTISPECIES: AraC family transcriptional regulator [unclassified Streptomyces]|uniref:AraC family transcriptional regulator n=1 Tax=unclassified Streptomyces TaxID=2593676 RepID=UPI00136F1B01|nr:MULTISPECIES: AraC family transcriptional regulator [unclassified Streptomyces]MCW5251625.1 AraC family transcriptional regulator [Streptomyces sp. SHP 1-2]MYU23473.1 helix-turn-helix domain-containing protein [Streptomyces sp. SID8352]